MSAPRAQFSILLPAIYSALQGLLVSEDNALLSGSLLLFALIAAAMLLTRKADGCRVGTNRSELAEKPSGAD